MLQLLQRIKVALRAPYWSWDLRTASGSILPMDGYRQSAVCGEPTVQMWTFGVELRGEACTNPIDISKCI